MTSDTTPTATTTARGGGGGGYCTLARRCGLFISLFLLFGFDMIEIMTQSLTMFRSAVYTDISSNVNSDGTTARRASSITIINNPSVLLEEMIGSKEEIQKEKQQPDQQQPVVPSPSKSDDEQQKVLQAVVKESGTTTTDRPSTAGPTTTNPPAGGSPPLNNPSSTPLEEDEDSDIFNPNLTMEDYYRRYEFQRKQQKQDNDPATTTKVPSKEWLTSCAKSLSKDTNIQRYFQVLHPFYRLGDCIRRCDGCAEGKQWNRAKRSGNFTSSMAIMYRHLACFGENEKDGGSLENFTVLDEIFKDFGSRPGFEKPDPDVLVIHLRLGDVIENGPWSAEQLLLQGGYGAHPDYRKIKTIHSIYEYLDVLNEMNNDNKTTPVTKKIHIVGGSHKDFKYQKSKVYAHCLQRGLAMAGYKVEMWIEGREPDQDFYFMSHAKKFMVSTGGFSMMIGHMVQRNGGQLVGGSTTDLMKNMGKPGIKPSPPTTTHPILTPGPTNPPSSGSPSASPPSSSPEDEHNDIFNPNLTMEDYYRQHEYHQQQHTGFSAPTAAIPSKEWLTSCAKTLSNDTNIQRPFQVLHPMYRLGDCIKHCDGCTISRQWNSAKRSGNFTSSMALMYQHLACGEKGKDQGSLENFTVLDDIFEEFGSRPGFEKPDPDVLVIHLRLGDVIENAAFSVEQLLLEGGNGAHPKYYKMKTIHSIYKYLEVLNELNNNDKTTTTMTKKIHIVGGSHKDFKYQKSKVYAHCLQRGLAKAGYKVEMWIEGREPDQDFYFMSHAKKLMVSTGGFSRMIGLMVERKGGQLVGSTDVMNLIPGRRKPVTHPITPGPTPTNPPSSGSPSPISPSSSPEDEDSDIFNPNLTMEDYYSQYELQQQQHNSSSAPTTTIPSHEWLTSCAKSLSNDAKIQRPFQLLRPNYRLGDCIKLCEGCIGHKNWVRAKRSGDYTSRMSVMYKHLACGETEEDNSVDPHYIGSLENFTVLDEIFKTFGSRPGFEKPDPGVLVIHLRLGDVIERSGLSVGELLLEGGVGAHPESHENKVRSIHSFYKYMEILNELYNNLNENNVKTKKIHIVGGSHKDSQYQKSKVYAHCLQRGFAKAGYKVEMWIEGRDPDQDFYFMSHAKKLMLSTGGFSRMIGRMVERKGGQLVGSSDMMNLKIIPGKPTDWSEQATYETKEYS